MRNTLADSGLFVASYFYLADRFLRLNSGRLEELSIGSDDSQKIQADSSEITSHDAKEKPAAEVEPPRALAKAQTQKKAREEAASDLSRKTGDLSLYGPYLQPPFP
jgi:hypothetical protein